MPRAHSRLRAEWRAQAGGGAGPRPRSRLDTSALLGARRRRRAARQARQPFYRLGIVREEAILDPLALELAGRADAVIVAVGFDADIETEASDREFSLPPGQDALVRALAARNPRVAVVLTAGGSVDVSRWIDHVAALVAAWYPGQEGGDALARLLLGDENFSGRLPISWERQLADNPSIQSYYPDDPAHPERITYREGLFSGYRGHHQRGRAQYFRSALACRTRAFATRT